VTNNVFWDKKSKYTTEQKIKHKNPLPGLEVEPGTFRTQRGYIATAMGRNVNKQRRICGPHIFNKFIFSPIFFFLFGTIFIARLFHFFFIVFTIIFVHEIYKQCKKKTQKKVVAN